MVTRLKTKRGLSIRQYLRSKRGSALISGMLIGVISLFWVSSISSFMLAAYQASTRDRLQGVLRTATETALEWALVQLNNNTGQLSDPVDEDHPSSVTIPASTIAAVAPGMSLSATATLANVTPTATSSYLYDAHLDPGDASCPFTQNYWRVLTVTATTGGAFPKTKSIRIILKPRTDLVTTTENQTQTTTQIIDIPVTSTTTTYVTTTTTTKSYPLGTVPEKMLLANSISIAGSGAVTGDVHSNGNFTLAGSNVIVGNITTANNFSITGSGNITGAVTSLGNMTLNSKVTGPVTSKGTISTGGSSQVIGDMNAGGNLSLTAGMTATGNVRTAGTMTTSGSYTQTSGNIYTAGAMSTAGSFSLTNGNLAAGSLNTSGSFSMNTGDLLTTGNQSGSISLTKGNLVSGGNINTNWGTLSSGGVSGKGKAYYLGSNSSPSGSSGATNGIKMTSTSDSNYLNNYAPNYSNYYTGGNTTLQSALATANTAAQAVSIPAAPDHPTTAIQLSSTALTKSGSNNVTLTAGDYYINGPIDFSGSTNLTVSGPVRLWLEGSNAYIKFAGSNNITLPSNNPTNLQIYTNSSKPISFSGSTNIALGYIYAPNAAVTMAGSNNAKVGGIIANTIAFSGASGLTRQSGSSYPWGSGTSSYSVDVTTSTTAPVTVTTTTMVPTPTTVTTVTPVSVTKTVFNNSWQVVSYQEM